MRYETPQAFKMALEARIRNEARKRAQPIARVRQLLVFDRFLARVFATLGERAVAKGGAVLELRLARARTTRDVDLKISGDPGQLLEVLRRACALDLDDFLAFVIDVDPEHPEITGEGIVYEGRRYRAEARLAGKIYGDRFGVDAGFGDVLTSEPDIIEGTDFFEFAGLARTRHRVYPREAHVAEKLHAYTLPRTRENTRVKDLPDLALLATTGAFDGAALRRAIDVTFGSRKSHAIPSSLPDPPASWGPKYREIADRDGLDWRDLATCVAAVRAFVDPILGAGARRWDPDRWAWVDAGA